MRGECDIGLTVANYLGLLLRESALVVFVGERGNQGLFETLEKYKRYSSAS
jgi:hypothetical protein